VTGWMVDTHYRRGALCLVSNALPSVIYRVRGSDLETGHIRGDHFTRER